ncbi:MAG: hypothetical protein JSV51_08360 [Candidatus Bathyarchaeota archaeon]|nr:MAG: hypothetical protein JSV51_08360 [Candidatus Bathyarchaeota archaeon]
MKTITLFLLILFLSITSISLITTRDVKAASLQAQVAQIDHVITPIYGGLLLINDTIRIFNNSTTGSTIVENFSIGFPLKYRSNLRLSKAFNAENPEVQLNLILDTGLGIAGYYGVTVIFPNGGITLDEGQSYTFNVVFLFSDLISSSTETAGTTASLFTADFPVFPSLTQEALTCNVTVILPENTEYAPNDFPFDITQKDERYYLNHTQSPLPRFTHRSLLLDFIPETVDSYASFSASKMNREVRIHTENRISISEQILLRSKTTSELNKIRLSLPEDAFNISALDEQGKILGVAPFEDEINTYEISLNLAENQSRSLRLVYDFPNENNSPQQNLQNYMLTLNLSENLRIMPEVFTLKVILPEGATFHSFPQQAFNIQRDVFQETISTTLANLTWLQNEQWSFTYSYSIFWSSFRPTLWATALVIIGSLIAFAWQRPKAPVSVTMVLVPHKTLNDFVETYEEKKRIISELEQTTRKMRKGKISRRRYKVRKTTLENRITSLSKKIMDLRQKIMSSGAKYADIMRLLEVAETELDSIEADIRRIEIRFKRGEISAQTHRRLLENNSRRREKAKMTIDGALLRLRE